MHPGIDLAHMLSGALVVACAAVAVFFLRFFRDTRDRFFALFALSFGILALHWLILGLVDPLRVSRPLFYLLRLAAFVLIIVAIVDKNRPTPRRT